VHRLFALLSLLLCACIASFISSCASGQGIAPPGGPADTTAPAIVSTNPPNGSANFHERVVSAEFSEYVDEARIADAIVITPIPHDPPKIDVSGKRVEIEFREPLVENRTYAVTFGSSVVDLSGNRLGRPYTLRFSTGSTIDSGTIRGTVIGAEHRKAFIFAYLVPADSSRFSDTLHPDSTRPDFVAPVGDDGSFSLEALPRGTYRLFAIVDEYGDQLFTPGVDAFGVARSDVQIDAAFTPVSGISIRLRPAPEDITPPSLYSARSVNRSRTELRFSEPIDTATLKPANFTLTTSAGNVQITDVWRSSTNRLLVQLAHAEIAAGAEATVRATNLRDTVGNPLPDSASSATFTVSDERDTLPPVLLPLQVDSVRGYSFPDSIALAFDEAVRTTAAEGTVVLRDTSGTRVQFRLVQLSPAQFLAFPTTTPTGLVRGMIEINLGSFADLAGNRRDSAVRVRVAVNPPRQNGTLQGTLTDSAAPNASHVIVVQMVGTNKVFRKVGVRSGAWEFAAIPEGEYQVSAFRDDNGNGEYDYGSIVPFRRGEEFTTWRGTVRVRPRWVTNKVDLVIGGR
jgi:uncharacterized protein (DUF2141 family)/methionine-rich copper-binding protein CopC